MTGPRRIVCLTSETTETLYLLGEQERIAGISGFTVRPPQARREKPRVAAYTSAKIDQIVALKPDLVLGFSDLQAGIAAELVGAGIEVHIFNQRSVAQILDFIRMLGGMVGVAQKAQALIGDLQRGLDTARETALRLPCRPRVYFEEWDEPMISGILWVSELIGHAGGVDCFADLGALPKAQQRIVADPAEVLRRAPDLVIGSWCGKKFAPARVAARPGWDALPAVRRGRLHEIKSCDILQPGPAALGDGLRQLQQFIGNCARELAA